MGWNLSAGDGRSALMSTHDDRAQEAEQKLRDDRDRNTLKRGPPPKGEPRYRNGADTTDTGREGWSEVEGEEEPPKGQG